MAEQGDKPDGNNNCGHYERNSGHSSEEGFSMKVVSCEEVSDGETDNKREYCGSSRLPQGKPDQF